MESLTAIATTTTTRKNAVRLSHFPIHVFRYSSSVLEMPAIFCLRPWMRSGAHNFFSRHVMGYEQTPAQAQDATSCDQVNILTIHTIQYLITHWVSAETGWCTDGTGYVRAAL